MSSDRGRLSVRWFDHERHTWKRLIIWTYVLIGLAFAPLLFGRPMSALVAYAWLGMLVVGMVVLCGWLAVRITRSIRLGREDLRRSREAEASDEAG
jgi:hypothetical protein